MFTCEGAVGWSTEQIKIKTSPQAWGGKMADIIQAGGCMSAAVVSTAGSPTCVWINLRAAPRPHWHILGETCALLGATQLIFYDWFRECLHATSSPDPMNHERLWCILQIIWSWFYFLFAPAHKFVFQNLDFALNCYYYSRSVWELTVKQQQSELCCRRPYSYD